MSSCNEQINSPTKSNLYKGIK
uniref:Uncharacterized protein n=1 Tax=Rhizophora mucronata TaxID=61149 RepID=A0A2P2P7D8_RHIMU